MTPPEKYILSQSHLRQNVSTTYRYTCTSSKGSQNWLTIQSGVDFTLTNPSSPVSLQLTNIFVQQVPLALGESSDRYPQSYLDFCRSTHDYLQVAKDLLNDYVKGNSYNSSCLSACSLFFTGHWNRHHLKEVSLIVEKITNGKIHTSQSLVAELNAINPSNPNGSFARRKDFIKYMLFGHELPAEHRDGESNHKRM